MKRFGRNNMEALESHVVSDVGGTIKGVWLAYLNEFSGNAVQSFKNFYRALFSLYFSRLFYNNSDDHAKTIYAFLESEQGIYDSKDAKFQYVEDKLRYFLSHILRFNHITFEFLSTKFKLTFTQFTREVSNAITQFNNDITSVLFKRKA
jgi:hypothetical protein